MTILSTYQKICTLNAASSGITSAPSEMPTRLNDVSLPCALTIPGPGEGDLQAIGLRRQKIGYIVRVFVKPVSEGMGVDEGFQACMAPAQALINTYIDNDTLDDTIDFVEKPFSFSGIRGDMEFAGVRYHGFELVLNVVDKTTTS